MRFPALLSLTLAGLLIGCAAMPDGPPPPEGSAAIGKGPLLLTLPLPPGYPGETEMAQSVVADYGGRKIAFDALVRLSQAEVVVIVTSPSGPRIASITWTSNGVSVQTGGAPLPGFRAENVLADLMLANWPGASIEAATGGRLRVTDLPDGRRIVERQGADGPERVIDISAPAIDAEGSTRRSLTNHDFGYSLTMVTREAL